VVPGSKGSKEQMASINNENSQKEMSKSKRKFMMSLPGKSQPRGINTTHVTAQNSPIASPTRTLQKSIPGTSTNKKAPARSSSNQKGKVITVGKEHNKVSNKQFKNANEEE